MKRMLFALILISSLGLYAQDIEENQNLESIDTLAPKVKRLSVGLKIGIPNIAGLSLEAVTPLLGNRVAPFADFSGFNIAPESDIEVGLAYTEFGSNFYFSNKGKGAYVGVGFGSLATDLTFSNVRLEDDFGNSGTGNVEVKESLNITNLKIGYKTGGRFYFRIELGYGFGDIPTEVDLEGDFTYEVNGDQFSGTGTQTEDFPTIPGVGESSVLVGNFGFGISF